MAAIAPRRSHGYALVRGGDAIASLAEFPRRCTLAPESKMFAQEVRHLLYGRKPHTYRVLFTIQGSSVYVLHIRHGRREPLKQ